MNNYFIFGDEPFLIKEQIKTILDEHPVDDIDMLDTEQFGEDEVIFLNQVSFSFGERVCICRADLNDEMLAYLKEPTDNVLIIAPTTVDKRKKAFKEVQNLSKVIECNKVNEAGLKSFIKDRIQLSDECITQLMSASCYLDDAFVNLYTVDNMITLLRSHGNITTDVIDELCGTAYTQQVFSIANAYVSKDYKRFIKEIEATKKGEGIKVLALLSSNVQSAYCGQGRSAFNGYNKSFLAKLYNILQDSILELKNGGIEKDVLGNCCTLMISVSN